MAEFTTAPYGLTYEMGSYSGSNWWVATVELTTREGDIVTGQIVTDHCKSEEWEPGEPEDDLRLWSAAPDMLKMLIDAANFLTYVGSHGGGDYQECLDMIKRIDAVIEKATGEPSPIEDEDNDTP